MQGVKTSNPTLFFQKFIVLDFIIKRSGDKRSKNHVNMLFTAFGYIAVKSVEKGRLCETLLQYLVQS